MYRYVERFQYVYMSPCFKKFIVLKMFKFLASLNFKLKLKIF